jgi:hypothetical protein
LVPITIKRVHIEKLKIFDPKFIFTCTFPTRTKKKKSNKRKINQKKKKGLGMPAAPVISTLTGSFSMFRKLRIYLTSFQ